MLMKKQKTVDKTITPAVTAPVTTIEVPMAACVVDKGVDLTRSEVKLVLIDPYKVDTFLPGHCFVAPWIGKNAIAVTLPDGDCVHLQKSMGITGELPNISVKTKFGKYEIVEGVARLWQKKE